MTPAHRADWATLPAYIQKRAVEAVDEFLNRRQGAKEMIRAAHEANPYDWYVRDLLGLKLDDQASPRIPWPFHLRQGMAVRNALREAGLLDAALPKNNWDDYYIAALEIAAGIEVPS